MPLAMAGTEARTAPLRSHLGRRTRVIQEYANGHSSPDAMSTSTQSAIRKRRKTTKTVADDTGRPDDGLRSHKRMASRFAKVFTGRFIWTPGRGWLEFNGAYWAECGDSRPWNALHTVCRLALADLATIDRSDWRDELFADVRACDTAGGTEGALKHARHWPGIGKLDDDLDTHADLFVVPNGTYDLSARVFRPSDPADLMTLAGGVNYDPEATCPTYDALMTQYQPDDQVRAYLHRLGGAAMQGRQNLQQLITWYGQTGGNGKGTTMRAWQHVYGAYTHMMPVEAMLARKGYDQYKDEKAQLKGKRLVFLTEPSQGQKFDTGTVKGLTGGDPVTSRAVYKASVTFKPTWLVIMPTNNRVATPKDGGMERRLKELGWLYTVPKGEERDGLDSDLIAEGSGILNRLIEGWTAYQADGIQEPDIVTQATLDYLTSVDPVAQFLDECIMDKEGINTPSSSIYQAYSRWCADNGERPMSSKLFSPDLQRRGYIKKASKAANVWTNIALVVKDESW